MKKYIIASILVFTFASVTYANHSWGGYHWARTSNPFTLEVGNNLSSNYANKDLAEVKDHMTRHNILNPSVIIDVSHDNCVINNKKDHSKQPSIIYEIMNNINDNPELKKIVKGFMVESFIKSGNQKIDEAHPENIDMSGLSITDPCLSFEETEELLINLAGLL